jgi:hypothetical protein
MSQKTTVIDVIKRHKELLDILLFAAADHAEALFSLLEKCSECGKPATVEHQHTGVLNCDRCAAEFVYVIRCSDKIWLDLSYADGVRRIREHHESATSMIATVH